MSSMDVPLVRRYLVGMLRGISIRSILMSEVRQLRENFGSSRLALAGDRGMQTEIREIRRREGATGSPLSIAAPSLDKPAQPDL